MEEQIIRHITKSQELLKDLQLNMSRAFKYKPMYEGTVDEAVVAERRVKQKNVKYDRKGRSSPDKFAREENKRAYRIIHEANRKGKAARQQEALNADASTSWTSEWRVRNEDRKAAKEQA